MKTKSMSSEQTRLQQQRKVVLAELDYLRDEMQTEVDFEPDEGDEQITEHETAAILVAILQQRLLDIEAALAAIAAGKYNHCERCGGQIEPARLMARPDARYCINCQVIVEKVIHQSQMAA
jgi:DnaK suppressor protein